MNSLSIMFTCVIIILFTIGHIQLVTAKVCSPNEEYVKCEIPISCQPSCDKPNGTLCLSLACVEGCHCKQDFVRASDTDLTCIRKDQCGIINTNNSTCGPNEIHVDCALLRSCQRSCKNPDGTICPRVCDINSCICQKGFVRDNDNNLQCIEQTQCKTTTTRRPVRCGENEVAVQCALLQTCQPSCDEPNGTICPFICSRNPCVCKEGFIRDPKNNFTCIEKSQCDEVQIGSVTETPTCGENEEYNNCTNPCQPSCIEPNRKPCETVRCSKGCICSKGYLRDTNDIKSPCTKCSN